jgi:acetyl esterase/lipase
MSATPEGVPRTGTIVPIWPGVAPGSESWTWSEQELVVHGDRTVRNVSSPTLEVFEPTGKANGTTVIIAPGGAYHYLSIDHEGTDLARWMTARGVAAFVLRYRVRHTPEDDAAMLRMDRELAEHLARTSPSAGQRERIGEAAFEVRALAEEDGRQAIRFLRARVHAWGIEAERIGFVGFSAGAGVAVAAATTDDAGNRPDFVAALYGPRPEVLVVPQDAPELFLVHVSDDSVVPAAESVAMWEAWQAARRPVELHLYRSGGHGFGMKRQGAHSGAWPDLLEDWMRRLGLFDSEV